MRWFKHMSDMSMDVRVRRLIREHGVAGYGLYVMIIELITRRLTTESPIPDLEETAEDLAEYLRMDTILVEKIVKFCITQGLLEIDEIKNRVVANKIYKYLQQSDTRSPEIRKMVEAYKKPKKGSQHLSETVTDKCDRTEQNRLEQNRKDDDANNHHPVADNESDDKIIYYCQYFTISESKFKKYCKTFPTVEIKPEFSKMELYLDDNPDRYQGPDTIHNFISKWLNNVSEDVATGKKKGIYKSDIPVFKCPPGWKDESILDVTPGDHIE